MTGLLIDNFAGGGGASTGIEAALGRAVDVAINHDPEAVAMHAANHPGTHHFCQSIMAVDPLDATGGLPVALAWFSPDCKHHSKAKGGKPREKNIRDLAWIVVHWAERLRKATPGGLAAPAIIMLENVEEFRQWGPLDAEGKPIAERRGEEFDLWLRGLKRQGYKVQHRELRACDYGAPTSRKRLFLIARRDGLPIVWPEPTHGKPGSPEVLSGQRKPWRTAAECIDWSIPCRSIFDRARPLKDTTHRRIAHGVMRYVVNAASPFIVPLTHHGDARRVYDPADPFATVTGANRGEMAAVDATLAPHVTVFRGGAVGCGADEPLPTVTANSFIKRPGGATPLGLAGASIVPITHTSNGPTAHDLQEPLRTITTAKGGELAVSTTTLTPVTSDRGAAHDGKDVFSGRSKQWTVNLNTNSVNSCRSPDPVKKERSSVAPNTPPRNHPTSSAMPPLTGGWSKHGGTNPPSSDLQTGGTRRSLIAAHLEKFSENSRGRPAEAPLDAVMAGAPRQAVVSTFLSHFYTSNTNGGQGDPLQPAKTITSAGQHHALVAAHMEQANTGRVGHPMTAPVSTIVGKGCTQRLVETTMIAADALPADVMAKAVRTAAFLIKYYGSDQGGHGLDAPIGTVTTLNRFAVVTVTIDATTYVIVDIGMRMLTPRELARAQGFPDSYILDAIGPNGKPLNKTAQIRMIGNSVCPDMARALVTANVATAAEQVAA
jgi:DNA (cytosine-5)-methyltransferase 1